MNLASLLIASQDVTKNKSYACGEVSVVLKTKDPRLNRKLSMAEFVLAFLGTLSVLSVLKGGLSLTSIYIKWWTLRTNTAGAFFMITISLFLRRWQQLGRSSG